MAKIKIMTDSASDISVKNERELGIHIIPFPVAFGEKTYLSRIDFDNDGFFELLEKADQIPVTSQITAFQYGELFMEAYAEGVTDLINVTINAEASGTYNSACLAARLFYEANPEAKDVFRIYNVDGFSYTAAYGHAVVEGARMARDGKTAGEIVEFIQNWVQNSVIYFVPYTLKYAAKSGRIPSAAAFVGELVGLKPIMRISDHKIVTNDKVRGEKKVINTIVSKAAADMEPGSPYIVMYGSHPENADALERAMTEAVGYPPVDRYQIGVAIAANSGPYAVGVLIQGK